MDDRVESLRFLTLRLSLANLVRLGLIQIGIRPRASLPLSNGFSLTISKAEFHRVYDILHIFDDGWEIEELGGEKLRIHSDVGETVMNRCDFLDGPWRAVLAASGWLFRAGLAERNGFTFHDTDDLYVIHETFDYEVYKPTQSVAGKVVVDVGASFGDTAVYFSRLGAKVYGFEPVPAVFSRAVENLRLNACEEQVVLVNAAIGISTSSDVEVPNSERVDRSAGFSLIRKRRAMPFNSVQSVRVPVRTLADVTSSLQVQLLKMDCEGSEYDIILRDYDSVRKFDELFVEWHESITKIPVERLVRRLEGDFEVTVSYGLPVQPRKDSVRATSRSDVGMLHAVKRR
jgi:FkbM family methyltransferase